MDQLNTKYQNLIRNIKLYWLEEIVEVKRGPVLQLPKVINQKYQKAIGKQIQHINQVIIQELAAFRVDTMPSTTTATLLQHDHHLPSHSSKENSGKAANRRVD